MFSFQEVRSEHQQSSTRKLMETAQGKHAVFPSTCGVLPTHCKQTLLYRVPLGLGEAAAFGQAVDGVQQGVDERGEGLRPRKQRRTFGEQRQHSSTQIPVEGEGHVCSTEGSLEE